MQTTTLGPFTVGRIALGTMLMGDQDAGRGVPPDPRSLRRGGRHPRRHRRRLLGRRLGGDARAVAAPAPRRGRARHQVPLRGLRPGRRRARPGPDRPGLRRQPAPPGRRRDRPLPGARARSRHAAGGDARGARRARARRQGARARRLQLPRLAAGLGGRHPGPRRAGRRSSRCSPSTRSSSGRSRPRSCRSAAPPGWPCSRGARSAPAFSAASTGAASARPRTAGSPTRTRRSRRPTTGARPNATSRSSTRRTRSPKRAKPPIAQVAIAWLLGTPGVTAPIIGPRTYDQLEDLLAADAHRPQRRRARPPGGARRPAARLPAADAARAVRDRRCPVRPAARRAHGAVVANLYFHLV